MNTSSIRSRDDLLTDCERSMRYHQVRASFYNSAHLHVSLEEAPHYLEELLAGRMWGRALVNLSP